MKIAIKEAADIKRMMMAAEQTESKTLRTDYKKAIRRKKEELKEYCFFKGIDFKNLQNIYGF